MFLAGFKITVMKNREREGGREQDKNHTYTMFTWDVRIARDIGWNFCNKNEI